MVFIQLLIKWNLENWLPKNRNSNYIQESDVIWQECVTRKRKWRSVKIWSWIHSSFLAYIKNYMTPRKFPKVAIKCSHQDENVLFLCEKGVAIHCLPSIFGVWLCFVAQWEGILWCIFFHIIWRFVDALSNNNLLWVTYFYSFHLYGH